MFLWVVFVGFVVWCCLGWWGFEVVWGFVGVGVCLGGLDVGGVEGVFVVWVVVWGGVVCVCGLLGCFCGGIGGYVYWG